MRDKRYIAEHRGGPLSEEQHWMLARWAADCVAHVMPLFLVRQPEDLRPQEAVVMAYAWSRGDAAVGEARKAAVDAHAAAREAVSDAARFVARAAGHAVATAHMADHAPGVVWYIRKALLAAGMDAEAELCWQVAQLPEDISDLVVSTLQDKYSLEILCSCPEGGVPRRE